MPIPDLNADGILPFVTLPTYYDCTLDDIGGFFGKNRWIQDTASETRRETLCTRRGDLHRQLCAYLKELVESGLRVEEVIVDGSFITDKPNPNDIDLIVVLPAGFDLTKDLTVSQENLVTTSGIRRKKYDFDVKVASRGSEDHKDWVFLYSKVKYRTGFFKGLLRVVP